MTQAIITRIPTSNRAPLAIQYMVWMAGVDKDQDKLERMVDTCSLGGLFCQRCIYKGACQKLYDVRTDRNIEHY